MIFPLRASTALLSCAAALVLAGCGGSGGDKDTAPPSDPLAAYKNQTVNWASCAPYFSDGDSYSAELAKLGDRVQCADIKAPLDYQNPDGLQITLSMLRVRAAESHEKKPNLFFNPGGPGGDGQQDSLSFSMLLSNGNPDSVLGRKYKELSDSYNFVGFSPRGVGASTRIACAGNELVYQTEKTQWGDSAENIRRLTDLARYTASNCQKNPVADYIHTDATARDMDLMRHLLGDEKLHYHGTSYGTWLGFWYAGIFPERVGPMVLDSNVDFTNSFHEVFIDYRHGQIHTFKEFIAPYIARHDSVFGMGSDAKAVIDGLNAVGREVSQALLDIGENFRAEPEHIPNYVSAVKAAIETQKLVDQKKSLDEIKNMLSSGRYILDDEIDAVFKVEASRLIERMETRADPLFYTTPEPLMLDNDDSVWTAVVCNDEPMRRKDVSFWIDKAFELARSARVADIEIVSQPCLHWERKQGVSKPSMASLKDAALLMVQSEFDVPTPLEGAMRTFDALPAARMIRVRNEGRHGVMVYRTECVDLAMMDYLLGKAPAQRLTECQGKPLRFDAELPQNTIKAAQPGAEHVSHFKDPELAASLLEDLRKAVRP